MTPNDTHQSSGGSSIDGTILITGANGSLALSFIEYLLATYPSYSAILAVRDASDSDPNTSHLRKIVSRFPSAKVSIEALDLGSLSDVRSFADAVTARVSAGEISPLSAIVCNAFAWSLTDTTYSKDGYELGFQVSHLSHFLFVLKLLGSMNKDSGRIVLLGSDAHDSKNKSIFNPLGAKIPENLEEIVKPTRDEQGKEMSRGFKRYSNSKLAEVMFMHSLNTKLQQQNSSLRNITVTAMDPGGMPTSRCFQGAPLSFRGPMYIVGNFILPMVQHFTSAVNTTKTSGRNLVAMSVDSKYKDARGYFVGPKAAISSVESRDEKMQEKLLKACEKWSGFQESESVLKP